jgi:hypothetical protein
LHDGVHCGRNTARAARRVRRRAEGFVELIATPVPNPLGLGLARGFDGRRGSDCHPDTEKHNQSPPLALAEHGP